MQIKKEIYPFVTSELVLVVIHPMKLPDRRLINHMALIPILQVFLKLAGGDRAKAETMLADPDEYMGLPEVISLSGIAILFVFNGRIWRVGVTGERVGRGINDSWFIVLSHNTFVCVCSLSLATND